MKSIYFLFSFFLSVCTFAVEPRFDVDMEAALKGETYLRQSAHPVGTPYLNINAQVFDRLPMTWDDAEKQAWLKLNYRERRTAILDHYGLIEAPYDNQGAPMGFVPQADGKWTATCTLCHSNQVAGQFVPGSSNAYMDQTSLLQDITKYRTQYNDFSNLSFMEKLIFQQYTKDILAFPADETRGTYNVWPVGNAWLTLRDFDLSSGLVQYLNPRKLGNPLPAYLDPLVWWNVKYKTRLYSEPYAPKNGRTPMLAGVPPLFTRDQLVQGEKEFENVLKYFDTLPAPKYQGPVDSMLAGQGKVLFEKTCARCHGTYDGYNDYPEKVIPYAKVGTDSARAVGNVTTEFRQFVKDSWFGNYGKDDITLEPVGYVAPPLHGVWASAPYFHNGSVPTLRQVLFTKERAVVWKVQDIRDYDHERMGLKVAEYDEVPKTTSSFERRKYYDTRQYSRSKEGHWFPEVLNPTEKLAVLEYLKTI